LTAGTERKGLVLGLVGIAVFSLTLPATRIAVTGLDPLFVGAGRCVVAALLGILYLLAVRSKWPLRSEWVPLLITAGGVVFGFPLLTSLAMRQVDASHGAIVVALLPLATAAVASLRGGERPSAGFWAMGFLGSGAVILFALLRGAGAFSPADLLLLCAVVAAGFGYAEGGKLSRTRESLEVISWALVVSLPVTIPVAVWFSAANAPVTGIAPWAGFAYVAVFSQFLGFQAWYRGLAIGGIARVGQLQLLQVFLTLFASALLLGEKVDALEVGFAATIVLIVALGRRMPVRRA
jgi:drug/metabolite transporter (DMT)-like permease